MKRRKKRTNQIILTGSIMIIAIIIVGIITTITVSTLKREKRQEQAVMEEQNVMIEEQPEMLSTESQSETVMALESDIEVVTQSDTEETLESQQQTEITVGALDDEQDPMNTQTATDQTGSGANVDMSQVVTGENKNCTLGIDVSKYQGTIDWKKVADAGIQFAMIRVGYRTKVSGVIYEDPTARYNMQEAQAAGIQIGAYFYSAAVSTAEAKEEADFTASLIAKYQITYPVAYNCEDFQSADSRQYNLDTEIRTGIANAFLQEIANKGYTPMFYAAKGEMENNVLWNMSTLGSSYKVWVAQYPSTPYPQTTASTYTGAHAMWQYTSQGSIAGINKKTDLNVAYFGYTETAQAKDTMPAEQVAANPEVGINFTEVNETVTAKQETNLRTEPSTLNDSSIVGKLIHGDTAVRTGIGHNGWSRLIYNGQTLYAVTNYLTTDMADTGKQAPAQGVIYTEVNEQVTAKSETNLRTEPSTASDETIVGMLHNGETLTCTGRGSNGWSRLDYNGQTVYAVTSYLTNAS